MTLEERVAELERRVEQLEDSRPEHDPIRRAKEGIKERREVRERPDEAE
jgi:hypothetical protein